MEENQVQEPEVMEPVYDIDLLGNETMTFTNQVVATDEEGNRIVLVDLYANMTVGENLSFNISGNVLNQELVEEYKEEVNAEIAKFIASMNAKLAVGHIQL